MGAQVVGPGQEDTLAPVPPLLTRESYEEGAVGAEGDVGERAEVPVDAGRGLRRGEVGGLRPAQPRVGRDLDPAVRRATLPVADGQDVRVLRVDGDGRRGVLPDRVR